MADVIPFKCCRPTVDLAAAVAAAPYDTFSRAEAAAEIDKCPKSFLRIDKPAALLSPSVDEYAPEVYTKARELLDADFSNGVFVVDGDASFYIYRLIQGQHIQTGIVAGAAVADYQNKIIKRHENTRSHKQQDRVAHINALEAHTGPVLLTYKANSIIDAVTRDIVQNNQPLFDFVAQDGVGHQVWRVNDPQSSAQITAAFAEIDSLYIADGHHRAAAAAEVAQQRRARHESGGSANSVGTVGATNPTNTAILANPTNTAQDNNTNEAEHFLVAIFPDDQMQVLDYNRVVSTLNGHSPQQLVLLASQIFNVSKIGAEAYKPQVRGSFGMYLDGSWYKLEVKAGERSEDPVDGMDIAILHSKLLAPVLGITDPRSNPHITYVGGARGLEELRIRADKTKGVAFSLYPSSLAELFAVADVGRLMPPKSTWFEPKPRSGLFIHKL